MEQLGFPGNWPNSPIWDRAFALNQSSMKAASMLDRTSCMTAVETRASLTEAEVIYDERTRTPDQAARAKKAAQRSLLRTHLRYGIVIEVEPVLPRRCWIGGRHRTRICRKARTVRLCRPSTWWSLCRSFVRKSCSRSQRDSQLRSS